MRPVIRRAREEELTGKMTTTWAPRANGYLRHIALTPSQGSSSRCAVVNGSWPTSMLLVWKPLGLNIA